MAVFLVPIEDGRPIVLDKAIVLIGRQADCDVVLTNSRRVSRRHCCVAQVNDSFVVRDLGSMNGVRVNGERVKREAPVQFGDVVSIGDLGFVLQRKDVVPSGAGRAADSAQASRNRVQRALQPAARPLDLSQEMPVAIVENDLPFGVEPGVQSPPGRDSAPDRIGTSSEYDVPDSRGEKPKVGDDYEEADEDGYAGTNSHFELLPD